MALQGVGKQLGAERNTLHVADAGCERWRHGTEPGAPPDILVRFDDERAHVLVIRVSVRLEHAMLALDDEELERVEHEVGGEPDVAAAAPIE